MPVEELKSIVSLPPVTRQREARLDPRGKERKPRKDKDPEEEQEKGERKVDITV